MSGGARKLRGPLAEVTWVGGRGKFKGTKEREPGEGRAGVLEEVNNKGKAESVFGRPGRNESTAERDEKRGGENEGGREKGTRK